MFDTHGNINFHRKKILQTRRVDGQKGKYSKKSPLSFPPLKNTTYAHYILRRKLFPRHNEQGALQTFAIISRIKGTFWIPFNLKLSRKSQSLGFWMLFKALVLASVWFCTRCSPPQAFWQVQSTKVAHGPRTLVRTHDKNQTCVEFFIWWMKQSK